MLVDTQEDCKRQATVIQKFTKEYHLTEVETKLQQLKAILASLGIIDRPGVFGQVKEAAYLVVDIDTHQNELSKLKNGEYEPKKNTHLALAKLEQEILNGLQAGKKKTINIPRAGGPKKKNGTGSILDFSRVEDDLTEQELEKQNRQEQRKIRRQKLRKLLPMGLSKAELARRLGVTPSTVYLDLKRLSEDEVLAYKHARNKRLAEERAKLLTGRKTKAEERRQELKKLLPLGLSIKELAERLFTEETTIKRDLKDLAEKGNAVAAALARQNRAEKIAEQQAIRRAKAEERRQGLKKLLPLGLSQNELAKRLGVSQTTIKGDLKELSKRGIKRGIIRRVKNQPSQYLAGRKTKAEERRQELKKLLPLGLSQTELAERLGVTPPTIKSDFIALGHVTPVTRRPVTSAKAEERRQELKKLLPLGLSQTELARRLGVHRKTISEDLKALEQ